MDITPKIRVNSKLEEIKKSSANDAEGGVKRKRECANRDSMSLSQYSRCQLQNFKLGASLSYTNSKTDPGSSPSRDW